MRPHAFSPHSIFPPCGVKEQHRAELYFPFFGTSLGIICNRVWGLKKVNWYGDTDREMRQRDVGIPGTFRQQDEEQRVRPSSAENPLSGTGRCSIFREESANTPELSLGFCIPCPGGRFSLAALSKPVSASFCSAFASCTRGWNPVFCLPTWRGEIAVNAILQLFFFFYIVQTR